MGAGQEAGDAVDGGRRAGNRRRGADVVATALDALGVRLGTTAGAIAASALAGGGYLLRFVLERRAGTGSAPEVQEQPAE